MGWGIVVLHFRHGKLIKHSYFKRMEEYVKQFKVSQNVISLLENLSFKMKAGKMVFTLVNNKDIYRTFVNQI
jgi:ABC-type polysaccharide/polyol phosphate transport system ATPase subunit